MDRKQIVHDLTVALASKSADTPDTIVAAYNELLPKVQKAYNNSQPSKKNAKARVLSSSEIFGQDD